VRERGGVSSIREYLVRGFPQAVKSIKPYIEFSVGLFFIGFIFAAVLISIDSEYATALLPENFFNSGSVDVTWDYPVMSAYIMTNNIQVAFTAFVFGILGGIGTLLILLYNGAILGALSVYMALAGNADGFIVFMSLILPHGVLELSAIFLSGACGLMIGKAILVPGVYRRRDALVFQAKKAVVLIPGIIVMLILAGLVEGFFTPLDISPYGKLAFALLTLVGWIIYLNTAHGHVSVNRGPSE